MLWRGPRGYSTVSGPEGTTVTETVTCQHGPCNRLIEIPPGSRPTDIVAGRCPSCWGIICLPCVERTRKFGCVAIEKWMEQEEAKGAVRQSRHGY